MSMFIVTALRVVNVNHLEFRLEALSTNAVMLTSYK